MKEVDAYSMDSFTIRYDVDHGPKGTVRFFWMFEDGNMVPKCDNGDLTQEQLVQVMTAFVGDCELTGETAGWN